MRLRDKYPLRKVIKNVDGKPWLVVLECGHEMCMSTDKFGYKTLPKRQRCIYCPKNDREEKST